MNKYFKRVSKIAKKREIDKKILHVFNTVLDFVDKEDWKGACHATSAIMYVLLTELGIKVTPFIGEIKMDKDYTDHSWIKVNDEIYDVAIYKPLEKMYSFGPVFGGIDLNTEVNTKVEYGVKFSGLDYIAKHISQISIGEYLENDPKYINGLWTLIEKFVKEEELEIEINEATFSKYRDINWVIK